MNDKEFVNRYFAPYMHLQPCLGYGQPSGVGNGCFVKLPPHLGYYHYKSDLKTLQLDTNIYPKYLLSDGRAISFHNAIYSSSQYINITVDVNGAKGRTISGVDVFSFYVLAKEGRCGGLHLGSNAPNGGTFCRGSEEHKMKTCLAQTEVPSVGEACGYFLETNNFKFPKDYPLKL